MLFKTDVFIVKKEGKEFPVGTPKLIKNLQPGDEIYFTLKPWGTSSKADNVTIHHVTNGTQHTLKKGKLFSAIEQIDIALK